MLFSATGGGHRAAAKALEQAFQALDPSAVVVSADPLIGEGPALVRRLASLYSPLIQRSRTTWGAIYYAANTRPSFAAIRAVFGRTVRKVILDLMHQHDPDLVVSVHPLLNHVAYQAIRRSGRSRALMTVITDLVEFHRGWCFPRADLVVVPTEAALVACRKRRVPEARLKLLGLPVDLRFRPPAPGERDALRRRFGLAEDRFTILVSGGGEGSGRLLQQVRALSWERREWQVIAVCGRNEKLRRRLNRLRFATPTLVLGFVDYMPDLLRTSDVAVGKAGPGAIGEALATGVPLIATSYLPGQETENVTFITESGIGRYVPQPDQLPIAINELMAEGRRRWSELAASTARIARPYASLDIAREGLALGAPYRASGQASR